MPIVIIAGTDTQLRKLTENMKPDWGEIMLTRTQAAARLGVAEKRVTQFVGEDLLTPYEEKLFQVPIYSTEDVETLRQSRLKRY